LTIGPAEQSITITQALARLDDRPVDDGQRMSFPFAFFDFRSLLRRTPDVHWKSPPWRATGRVTPSLIPDPEHMRHLCSVGLI
jgi:hypothetical protein